MSDARVVLRPWSVADAEVVLAAYAEPDMASQGGPLADLDAARAWCRERMPGERAGSYDLAVEADGVVVGNVAVSGCGGPHGLGWVSYWAVPAARGRGWTSMAVRGLCRFAFDELGLRRLELGHRVNNPASGKVADAAGFVAEGLERAKFVYDGIECDVRTCARLVTDPEPEGPVATVAWPKG